MLADGGDVVDKKLPRVGAVLRSADPVGHGLVPAKRVAAHQHVVTLGEREQEIRARKVVAIGRGAQSDPFQFARGHHYAALLADQLSKVWIVLHIVNDDRGTEDEAVASRMIAERARTRDIVEGRRQNGRDRRGMRATREQRGS